MLFHAPTISKDDEKKVKSFLNYCQCWCESVHSHHHTEEERYFPALEEQLGAGALSSNVTQHHLFEPPLNEFISYISSTLQNPSSYEGEAMMSKIGAFEEELVRHLKDEIGTLEAGGLKGRVSKEHLAKIQKMEEDHIKQETPLLTSLPFSLSNHSLPSFTETRWPPLPAPVDWMVRNVAWWVHSDWWEWGCCDRRGVVKEVFRGWEV